MYKYFFYIRSIDVHRKNVTIQLQDRQNQKRNNFEIRAPSDNVKPSCNSSSVFGIQNAQIVRSSQLSKALTDGTPKNKTLFSTRRTFSHFPHNSNRFPEYFTMQHTETNTQVSMSHHSPELDSS